MTHLPLLRIICHVHMFQSYDVLIRYQPLYHLLLHFQKTTFMPALVFIVSILLRATLKIYTRIPSILIPIIPMLFWIKEIWPLFKNALNLPPLFFIQTILVMWFIWTSSLVQIFLLEIYIMVYFLLTGIVGWPISTLCRIWHQTSRNKLKHSLHI